MKYKIKLFVLVLALLGLSACSNATAEMSDSTNGGVLLDGQCRVQYQTSDGSVIHTQWVENGAFATPPQPPRFIGRLFRSWEGDYSNITQDTVIVGVYEDVASRKNVIAADTVYGLPNQEFNVIIGIYGDVDFCGLDAELTYDNQMITYIGAKDVDGDVIINDTKAGKIQFNFLSMRNIEAEVSFVSLAFQASQNCETELPIQIKSIYAIDSNGNPTEVSCEVIPNKIIIKEAENEA